VQYILQGFQRDSNLSQYHRHVTEWCVCCADRWPTAVSSRAATLWEARWFKTREMSGAMCPASSVSALCSIDPRGQKCLPDTCTKAGPSAEMTKESCLYIASSSSLLGRSPRYIYLLCLKQPLIDLTLTLTKPESSKIAQLLMHHMIVKTSYALQITEMFRIDIRYVFRWNSFHSFAEAILNFLSSSLTFQHRLKE
jgi:hypothetical protein